MRPQARRSPWQRARAGLMAGFALATVGLAGCAAAGSNGTLSSGLDRSVMPLPGATPTFNFPDVHRRTLGNGLQLAVVERPGVSTVTIRLMVEAGALAEPPELPGLAALTASMLTEGTTTRTATELAEQVGFLAANLGSRSTLEAGIVELQVLAKHLEPALELFADVLTNPAFRETDWSRVRDRELVAIAQEADQPATIADAAFRRIVLSESHPLGRRSRGSEASIRAVSPEILREFHAQRYRPEGAHLIVVGDVRTDDITSRIERVLAGWRGSAPEVQAVIPAPVAISGTRAYLIDRPGSAQSEVRIGHFGVERTHPDFFPLLVLNTLLGGQFTSRINLNLREDKGYTYGARSAFDMRSIAGPFTASAGVETGVTRESIIEFMRELTEVRASRPATAEEVEFARSSIIRREPLATETNSQMADRLQTMILHDLPDDYYDTYTNRIAAVSVEEVNRVAREYLHPERMAIVIVGDRSVVESGLRQLPYPLELLASPQD